MALTIITGGCQCGAVRFRCETEAARASICHCRMCQKAFGNVFAPLVNVAAGALVWTKREPKRFQSSNHVMRGFCPDCGTPLTYEAPDSVALALGAFDDPGAFAPVIEFGTEGKLPFFDRLQNLPRRSTEADMETAPYLAEIVSFQHPDRPDDSEAS